MKHFRLSRLRFPPAVAVASVAAAVTFLLGGCANTSSQKTGTPAPNAAPAMMAATPPPTLTGAELYAINCNRCHPERSPIERRPTEWKTILTHMRVRANLPAAQARLILQYLQENSGS